MVPETIDWAALERLRAAFLDGSAGLRDYWQAESDLASYDQTFGARIGWKWTYVLDELVRRGWAPPLGLVLDWGCGSGVAGRSFLNAFSHFCTALAVWDRSDRAQRFAEAKARAAFPTSPVNSWQPGDPAPTTLLLSHVLTELSPAQVDPLLELACSATAVLWIEPGTFQASRRLIELRQHLQSHFQIVAPCTHQSLCPMLTQSNQEHWCHHFASPPPDVFTDAAWTRFGRLMEIDLRSLPLSYLVLDRRPNPPLSTQPVRILGRPRIYKAHALLLGCDSLGLREPRLTKRALPEQFRQVKKGRLEPLLNWTIEGDEITELTAVLR